eukprot:TRINITY_DN12741_c0_g1_i1.p1 TRINITY_DN12741_c0_g1~~TRINITY_DN12741_c0_g1_i1.p1  ORF type:complete len:561 (-),score=117.29 TRINITY_DN12741_c0_g1_i1:185-1789(-)
MASIGHPLVTDSKYNASCLREDYRVSPRLFLHACFLRCALPPDGKTYADIACRLPPQLQRCLSQTLTIDRSSDTILSDEAIALRDSLLEPDPSPSPQTNGSSSTSSFDANFEAKMAARRRDEFLRGYNFNTEERGEVLAALAKLSSPEERSSVLLNFEGNGERKPSNVVSSFCTHVEETIRKKKEEEEKAEAEKKAEVEATSSEEASPTGASEKTKDAEASDVAETNGNISKETSTKEADSAEAQESDSESEKLLWEGDSDGVADNDKEEVGELNDEDGELNDEEENDEDEDEDENAEDIEEQEVEGEKSEDRGIDSGFGPVSLHSKFVKCKVCGAQEKVDSVSFPTLRIRLSCRTPVTEVAGPLMKLLGGERQRAANTQRSKWGTDAWDERPDSVKKQKGDEDKQNSKPKKSEADGNDNKWTGDRAYMEEVMRNELISYLKEKGCRNVPGPAVAGLFAARYNKHLRTDSRRNDGQVRKWIGNHPGVTVEHLGGNQWCIHLDVGVYNKAMKEKDDARKQDRSGTDKRGVWRIKQ